MLLKILLLVVNYIHSCQKTDCATFLMVEAPLFEISIRSNFSECPLSFWWFCARLHVAHVLILLVYCSSQMSQELEVRKLGVNIWLLDVSFFEIRVKPRHYSNWGQHVFFKAREHLKRRFKQSHEDTILFEDLMGGHCFECDTDSILIIVHVVDDVLLLLKGIVDHHVIKNCWWNLHYFVG